MSSDGAETELSVVVLLLSLEYLDRRLETLSTSSCVSGVEDTANIVRVKIGDDVRTSAAVRPGVKVVVLVGNTGGTGASRQCGLFG